MGEWSTWNAAPVNSDWNTAANWTPALVPGEGDIASFNVSNITAISNSADAAVFGMVFNPGASTYTFTASALHLLTFTASGVTNNSGVIQQFVSQPDAEGNPGAINFTGPSTRGRKLLSLRAHRRLRPVAVARSNSSTQRRLVLVASPMKVRDPEWHGRRGDGVFLSVYGGSWTPSPLICQEK